MHLTLAETLKWGRYTISSKQQGNQREDWKCVWFGIRVTVIEDQVEKENVVSSTLNEWDLLD